MKKCACSNAPPKPPQLKRTARDTLVSVVAALMLVLLPKCPLCIVAYAAWLGIGVSISAATMIRYGVIVVCVGALVMILVRLLRAAKR